MKKQSVVKGLVLIGVMIVVVLVAGIAVVAHKRNQWKDVFYSCQYVRIHVYKEYENLVITNRMELATFNRNSLKGIIITNRKDILTLSAKLNPDVIRNSIDKTKPEGYIAWVGYSEGFSQISGREILLIINIHSNGIISQVTSTRGSALAVTRNPEYCAEVLRLIAKYQDSEEPIVIKEANPPGSPLRSSGVSR